MGLSLSLPSTVVTYAQWFQVTKTHQIQIHEFSSFNSLEMQSISVSGEYIFIFKICQIVANMGTLVGL